MRYNPCAFFLAISDTATDEEAVANATGVPGYFDPLSFGSTLLMKEKRVRSVSEEANRYVWEIQCSYSDRLIHPLDQPALFEWDFSEASETYFFDTDTTDPDYPSGKPVVNSAGQPFDALPSRETGAISLAITINVASDFDVSLFHSFFQCINAASFAVDGVSLDARQAKFSGANVSAVQRASGDYFRTVKMTLKFRVSWDDSFADMGYYSIEDDGKLYPITTGNPPLPITKPWPLDSGTATTNPTDTPAELTFKPYLAVDYSDLSALFLRGLAMASPAQKKLGFGGNAARRVIAAVLAYERGGIDLGGAGAGPGVHVPTFVVALVTGPKPSEAHKYLAAAIYGPDAFTTGDLGDGDLGALADGTNDTEVWNVGELSGGPPLSGGDIVWGWLIAFRTSTTKQIMLPASGSRSTFPGRITDVSGSFPVWDYTIAPVVSYDTTKTDPTQWVIGGLALNNISTDELSGLFTEGLSTLSLDSSISALNRCEWVPASYPFTHGTGATVTDSDGTLASGPCVIVPIGIGSVVDVSTTFDEDGNPVYSFYAPNSAQLPT